MLEVATDADPKEIRQSYIRAKNAYAPEGPALYSLMSRDECASMLESVEEAYGILSDPDKRRQYDSAHGLNSGVNFQVPRQTHHRTREREYVLAREKTMSKIITTRKFALDYSPDPEFDQEIDRATEFTGEFLKKIREYKNVDLPRMSELTRVSKTYLRYIESEEFDKLPAPVYVRGFIFQYAKCLRLNPDMVATSYLYRLKKKV